MSLRLSISFSYSKYLFRSRNLSIIACSGDANRPFDLLSLGADPFENKFRSAIFPIILDRFP